MLGSGNNESLYIINLVFVGLRQGDPEDPYHVQVQPELLAGAGISGDGSQVRVGAEDRE